MGFSSVSDLTSQIKSQQQFQKFAILNKVLANWELVMGKSAAYSKAVQVFNGVLWIVADNSVWSQQIYFQKIKILKQLENLVPGAITDLKLSTGGWEKSRIELDNEPLSVENHPSYLPRDTATLEAGKKLALKTKDPQVAFNSWKERLQEKFKNLPSCPECSCPTPAGELSRWGKCGDCNTKSART